MISTIIHDCERKDTTYISYIRKGLSLIIIKKPLSRLIILICNLYKRLLYCIFAFVQTHKQLNKVVGEA